MCTIWVLIAFIWGLGTLYVMAITMTSVETTRTLNSKDVTISDRTIVFLLSLFFWPYTLGKWR